MPPFSSRFFIFAAIIMLMPAYAAAIDAVFIFHTFISMLMPLSAHMRRLFSSRVFALLLRQG